MGRCSRAPRVHRGGNRPATRRFDFGRDAIGLLRGFDDDDVVGDARRRREPRPPLPAAGASSAALGTWPVFLRTVHGAAVRGRRPRVGPSRSTRRDVRTSIGAELSLDTVLGFVLPLTFTAAPPGARCRRSIAARAVFGRVGERFRTWKCSSRDCAVLEARAAVRSVPSY